MTHKIIPTLGEFYLLTPSPARAVTIYAKQIFMISAIEGAQAICTPIHLFEKGLPIKSVDAEFNLDPVYYRVLTHAEVKAMISRPDPKQIIAGKIVTRTDMVPLLVVARNETIAQVITLHRLQHYSFHTTIDSIISCKQSKVLGIAGKPWIDY